MYGRSSESSSSKCVGKGRIYDPFSVVCSGRVSGVGLSVVIANWCLSGDYSRPGGGAGSVCRNRDRWQEGYRFFLLHVCENIWHPGKSVLNVNSKPRPSRTIQIQNDLYNVHLALEERKGSVTSTTIFYRIT